MRFRVERCCALRPQLPLKSSSPNNARLLSFAPAPKHTLPFSLYPPPAFTLQGPQSIETPSNLLFFDIFFEGVHNSEPVRPSLAGTGVDENTNAWLSPFLSVERAPALFSPFNLDL